MARITSMTDGTGTSKAHPTEVAAEVSLVHGPDGEKLLQLSTFGSPHRVSEPKVSQTVQFDKEHAHELVKRIIDTFGAEENAKQ